MKKKQLILIAIAIIAIVITYKLMNNLKIKNIVDQLPKGKGSYPKRNLSQITEVVVHHSATDSGTALAYANYHISNRGWPGIGYHYEIAKDGTVSQTNDLTTVSWHATGHNTSGIGIVLTGNFDHQTLDAPQKTALVNLIKKLQKDLGRKLKIGGHRDYASKSCPGDNVSVEEIRTKVNGLLA